MLDSAVTTTGSNPSSFNPENERVKRDYFRHQREACGKALTTVDGMRKAINRFEAYTGYKEFTTFNKHQAIAFKKHLLATPRARGRGTISIATVVATTNDLKEFFRWLVWQRGYKGRLTLTDIEYLNIPENERRSIHERAFRPYPTIDQVRTVIAAMPAASDIEMRNRALLTMAILTGARDSALASLRLKHVDLDRKVVMQDPREVNTKRRKRIDTFLVPLGKDLEEIVSSWVTHLRTVKLYGDNDPVFPRTGVDPGRTGSYEATGIEPVFWANTQPIREIFKKAFEAAGLPYFPPHSFRHALVKFAEKHAPSFEHFKAFSQNIGHEHVATTLGSYGAVERVRQGELIRSADWSKDEARHDPRNIALFEDFMRWVDSGRDQS